MVLVACESLPNFSYLLRSISVTSFGRALFLTMAILSQPLVSLFLQRGVTQSLVRTTTAVTMFRGGVKTNVIPPSAWATVNHRIHPMQTIDEVSDRMRLV